MTLFGANQIIEDRFKTIFKVLGQVYNLVEVCLPFTDQETRFFQINFVGEDERDTKLRCNYYPVRNTLQI